MNKVCVFIFLLSCVFFAQAQKSRLPVKDRLYVNFGFGPSYSLYYKSGGWVRDWGAGNFDNLTVSRDVWGFSHFAEAEWRLKNPRWSIRAGYALHHFSPRYKKEGFTGNGTYYEFDTKETERSFYPQATVHYAIITGINRLEAGTGFYNQIQTLNTNNYYERIVTGPNSTAVTAFLIRSHKSVEAGFPFNIDYIRTLPNGNGVGARLNFNYTQSLRTAEHLALQLFFKAKLK